MAVLASRSMTMGWVGQGRADRQSRAEQSRQSAYMGIRAPRWSDEAECECLRARSISRSLSVGAMSRGEGRGEPRCFGWCAMRGRACIVSQCPLTGRCGIEECECDGRRRGGASGWWNGVGVGDEELGCWLLLNVQGRGRESIPALPFLAKFNSNSKEEAKKMLQSQDLAVNTTRVGGWKDARHRLESAGYIMAC